MIVIASTVVYGRVLVEIGAIARPFLAAAWPPILVLAAAMAASAVVLWLQTRGEAAAPADSQQPASLKTAFSFAALYVLVLLAVAFVNERLGTRGLYVVSVVSGLTDVDAITLSVARLVGSGQIDGQEGWRLVVRVGMAAALGYARLRRFVVLIFGLQVLVGAGLLVLWPR